MAVCVLSLVGKIKDPRWVGGILLLLRMSFVTDSIPFRPSSPSLDCCSCCSFCFCVTTFSLLDFCCYFCFHFILFSACLFLIFSAPLCCHDAILSRSAYNQMLFASVSCVCVLLPSRFAEVRGGSFCLVGLDPGDV
jgi:hypothetical protein